jgi:HK97 gp10 family phage protein
MATLKDIANQFESLAKLNISRMPNKAIRTGRLRDSIKVNQTRTNKAGGAIFDLNSVYYGVFVENGTSKMAARPFAAEAANSDQFRAMVDDYMKSIVQITLMEKVKETDKRLKQYTTKP